MFLLKLDWSRDVTGKVENIHSNLTRRKNEKMFPIINFGNVKVLRKTTFNFAVQKNLSPYILAVKIHLKNTRKN